MQYNTQHLLDWYQGLPFTDIIRIFPHSRLLELDLDAMQVELTHLEEVWCRKSIEERDIIRESFYIKDWESLSWTYQEELENKYFIPKNRVDLFIDEAKRPYTQTDSGRVYCSSRENYNYAVKN